MGAEVIGTLKDSQYSIYTSNSRLTYKTQHLYATGIKLILQLCECSELRRADRCEVGRVREQDSPFAVKKIVELDLSMGCLRLEVRSDRANPQSRLLRWNRQSTAEWGGSGALDAQHGAGSAAESSGSCAGDESRHCEVLYGSMGSRDAIQRFEHSTANAITKVDSMAMASSPRAHGTNNQPARWQ